MRVTVPGRGAAAATLATPLGPAGRSFRVTAVEYLPAADITGAATNSLTVQLVNGGSDGSLSLVIATLAMVAGVNSTRRQAKPIALTQANGAPVVLEDDQLRWESVKVGTGLLDPGGLVVISEGAL
jgi:hypothetical protein